MRTRVTSSAVSSPAGSSRVKTWPVSCHPMVSRILHSVGPSRTLPRASSSGRDTSIPSERPTRTIPGRSGEATGGVVSASRDSSRDQRLSWVSSSTFTTGAEVVSSRVAPDEALAASVPDPGNSPCCTAGLGAGMHSCSRNRGSVRVKPAQDPRSTWSSKDRASSWDKEISLMRASLGALPAGRWNVGSHEHSDHRSITPCRCQDKPHRWWACHGRKLACRRIRWP